jgi:tetratricopeptide (TPR) repeat protein
LIGRQAFIAPHQAWTVTACLQGKYDEAEQWWKRSLKESDMGFGKADMHAAVVANGFAELYRMWGGERFAGAEQYYKDSIEILRREIGTEDVRYAQALQYLGQYYLDARRYQEALQQLEKNAAIKKAALGEHHAEYASVRTCASHTIHCHYQSP